MAAAAALQSAGHGEPLNFQRVCQIDDILADGSLFAMRGAEASRKRVGP